MAEAKINLSIDGVKTVVSGFQEVGARVGDLMGKMSALTAIGGALSLAAFASLITSTAETAAGLHDLSIQTGATVEALSGLAEIGQYSDVSAEQIGGAMNKLAANMAGATEESKGTGKALEALGIAFNDFKQLSPDQQMLTIAKAMEQFEDGSGKAAIAMALYGKEGAKMLPFLKDLGQAGELEAKVTAAQAAASDNFSDNLTKLTVSGAAWKKELALGLLPSMSDLSDSLLGAINGSGGLRAKVRELANDGTLEAWGRGAVTALSYLIDVGQGLFSLFPMIGKAIGGVVAATTTSFGSIFDAWVRLQNLDFTGAMTALRAGAAGIKTIASETAGDISGIWNQELLGEKIRKGMDAAKQARQEGAKESKRQLDFTNVNDSGGKGGKGAAAVSEYERVMASIREKTTLQELEVQTVEKLSDGEKIAAKIMTDLRDNKLKLVATSEKTVEQQKIELTQALETLIASERTNEQKRDEAKATLAALEARSKYVDTLTSGLEKLKADSLAQQDHNDRLGLGEQAIAALDAARLDEQATILDGLAIKQLDKDLDEGLYSLYKAQAEELRKLASLKRVGGDKAELVRQQKEEADELKKIWDNFNENVQRNVGDTLYDAMNGKFDNIGESFRQLLLRMTADALAADLSNAVFGRRSGGGTSSLLAALADGLGSALGNGSAPVQVDSAGAGLPSDAFSSSGIEVRGRRASGGPVSARSLYEVNELGPELLSVGGRDFLMMGSQGGSVTPNHALGAVDLAESGAGRRAGSGAPNVTVNVINNSSATATTSETTDSRGNRRVEVMIGEAAAGEMRRAGSAAHSAVRSTFGVRPALVGR